MGVDRSAIYAPLVPWLRERAWELGYSLGLHGSMRRDLDIIAAPWIQDACGAEMLAHELAATADGVVTVRGQDGKPKPHGRTAWVIYLWRAPTDALGAPYIDLSVMPRWAA